jgi:hypothetical protein
MKRALVIMQMLLRSTVGNGEIVGTLVACGVAVTAGYLAIQQLGDSAKNTSKGQAKAISALPK